MASASVPGMPSWGNLSYVSLPGTRRPSPSHGRGLQVPLFFHGGVAGRADHRRWRAGPAPCCRPIAADQKAEQERAPRGRSAALLLPRAFEGHGNSPCAMGDRAPCLRGAGAREGQEGLSNH